MGKMVKMMLIVIFGYLFTSFPTSIFHVGFIEEENYPNVRVFVDILMWSSSTINPIIYCLLNETYRKAYIKLCRDFVGLPDETMVATNLASTHGRSMKSSIH